ncbi:MAG: ATP-binding protein [Pseudomonadota bacterium]
MTRPTRSLFLKIFIWFWLLLTLVSAVNLVVLFWKDAGEIREHRLRRDIAALGVFGSAALDLHAQEGSEDLIRLEEIYLGSSTLSVFLMDGSGTSLAGGPLPEVVVPAVTRALISGSPQVLDTGDELWIITRVEGVHSESVGVAAQMIPRRSALPPPLQPHILWQRLAVAFVLSGLLAWLLARSLSLPIARLKMSTRRLAEGDLEIRAPASVTRRKDELGDLAQEFDIMASRTQELVLSRDRMVRDISHELRSPLARLGVALELADRKAPDDVRPSLDRIQKEVDRLNELIGQLLTLSSMEGNPDHGTEELFEVEPLIREIVRDAAFEAAERGCKVAVTGMEDITLTGNMEMIRRAVENVLRNAVLHTSDGTTVDVWVEDEKRGNERWAVIRVRDRGPGVSAEHLEKIFQPFYRVAEARERQTGGAGIGLAIALRAVQAHGGTVTASNAPGGGLLVEISLPEDGRSHLP